MSNTRTTTRRIAVEFLLNPPPPNRMTLELLLNPLEPTCPACRLPVGCRHRHREHRGLFCKNEAHRDILVEELRRTGGGDTVYFCALCDAQNAAKEDQAIFCGHWKFTQACFLRRLCPACNPPRAAA